MTCTLSKQHLKESVTQQTFRVVSEEQETSFSPTIIASLTCIIKNSLERHKTLNSTTIPLYKQKNKIIKNPLPPFMWTVQIVILKHIVALLSANVVLSK